MFQWKQYPDLDRDLIEKVVRAEREKRSRASAFREFAQEVTGRIGVEVTAKACEVRYLRLNGRMPKSERPSGSTTRRRPSATNGSSLSGQPEVQVAKLVQAGLTVKQACERVAVETGLSSSTTRDLYYRWKRESGIGQPADQPVRRGNKTAAPPPGSTVTLAISPEDDLLLEVIASLYENRNKITGFNLTSFASNLTALVNSAVAGAVFSEEATQAAELRRELAQMRQTLETAIASVEQLRQENNTLRNESDERRRDYRSHYRELVSRWRELDEVCNEHLSQPPEMKIRYFRPFGERLRLTLDQVRDIVESPPVGIREL